MTLLMKFGLAASLLCLWSFAAGGLFAADLKVGDAAPSFEATDDAGKPWKTADHYGKKTVVVYFFPAAMTGG